MSDKYIIMKSGELFDYVSYEEKEKAKEVAKNNSEDHIGYKFYVLRVIAVVESEIFKYNNKWDSMIPELSEPLIEPLSNVDKDPSKIFSRKIVSTIRMGEGNVIVEMTFKGELKIIKESPPIAGILTYKIIDQNGNTIKDDIMDITHAISIMNKFCIDDHIITNGLGDYAGTFYYLLPVKIQEEILLRTGIVKGD